MKAKKETKLGKDELGGSLSDGQMLDDDSRLM
jgi:hypothetical protein